MISAFSSNWFIFFPLAFSLFVAMRLSAGIADREQRSVGVLIIHTMILLMFAFSLLAVGLRASPLGLVWIVLFAVFAFVMYWKNRRLERSAVLLTALSAREIPQQYCVAESFWMENRGWLRRKSAALRLQVATGTSWWESLELQGIALGAYEKLAVRLAARYGSQTKSTARVPGQSELMAPLQIEGEAERLFGRLMVFSWIIVVAPIVAMITTFILPTFKQMFTEFGLQLPFLMLTIIHTTHSLSNVGWATLLSLASLGLVAIVSMGIAIWIFPQLLQLPLLRWLCGDYYRSLGATALSRAIDEEPDLVRACWSAAELVSVKSIGRKYAATAQLLNAGVKPRDAFLKTQLLSPREFKAFGIAFDEQDPAWCLQQLASWKTARMLNRYSMLVQVAVVVMTLSIAIVVGAIAIGMLQSLTIMINSLS